MSQPAATPRIAIYGTDRNASEPRGFNLWPVGYQGAITHTGATPVLIGPLPAGDCWKEALHGIDGVILAESLATTPRQAEDELELVRFCRQHRIPLLAIDQGLLLLNNTLNGTTHADLSRELPEALQHRHPPEKGLRHAITVEAGTRLADLYGEGEVVVNSEHRQAVQRPARGFLVSARALDGVIEAIEPEGDGWFCLGVQWQPASASASGLDIQLFRGLVDACQVRSPKTASAAA